MFEVKVRQDRCTYGKTVVNPCILLVVHLGAWKQQGDQKSRPSNLTIGRNCTIMFT